MTEDKRPLILIHALLHAGAILLTAYLLAGSDKAQTITMLLIALWFGSGTLLFYPQRVLCEVRWLKRKFVGRSRNET